MNEVYENINSKDDDKKDDNEKFVPAPWDCLNYAFKDFGLELPNISGKMAEALMDDFFEIMEMAGILERKNKS